MFNKFIKINFLISYSFLLLIGVFLPTLGLNAEDENHIKNFAPETITKSEVSSTENKLALNSYILGPGDKLKLYLFGAPEFSGELTILNDGSVPFPLIGNQILSNLTLNQAKNFIQEKYKDQLLRPGLQLTIEEPRPIKVSVIGEVERPGIYTLTSNNNSQLAGRSNINSQGVPTLIDALQKAGGVTQNAFLEKVLIKRRLPGINNQFKQADINLLDIVMEGDQSQNLILFDGDIIKLNKANKMSNFIAEIAKTNLSPKTISVNVVGQVNNPGKIEVMANTPLIQGIYLAGGPKDWRANKAKVELVRINRNGTATRKKIRINLSQEVSEKFNPPLMNQDIVYVRSNTLNKIGTGLGTISDSISPVITGLTLFKLLD